MEHKIELTFGYTGMDSIVHKTVVFGKRANGLELMEIDEDDASSFPTQHQLMLFAAAITKFGEIRMPTPITVLLDLDAADLDDLSEAYNKFNTDTLAGRKAEFVSDSEVRLVIGYEKGGITYNRAIFGKRIKGRDMVVADTKGMQGLRRECYLIGLQIARLMTDDGAHDLTGPIEIEVFEQLDGADILSLRIAAARWRESFRLGGRALQEAVGAQHPAPGGENRVESQPHP